MIKVILSGACGRMGKEMAREINACAETELVAAVDKCANAGEFNAYDSLFKVEEAADVVVDFSHRSATDEVLKFALSRKLPLVIATTGQTDEDKKKIYEAALEIPIFFCGNMSLGVTLFVSLAAKIAGIFPYADVEIIETHHNKKADAPSGTALMLADEILKARGGNGSVIAGRGCGVRQKGEIGISSVRIGNVVGVHEVRINTGYQSFTLKHEAHSRALFAIGAMHAIKFIVTRKAGLYSVKDFL